MRFDIVTLFPNMFGGFVSESMLKRATEKGLLEVKVHQLRDWAKDKYKTVDDKPFGGGVGMIIKPEIVYDCLLDIKKGTDKYAKKIIVALSARGKRYTQKDAERLSGYDQLTLICGHYEGVDARIEDYMADECLSIGDYVLTGGEIPAMVLVDSIARLKKGVLGKDKSSEIESYSKLGGKRIREYPQYTRPQVFMGYRVPEELVSGDPKKIERWQRQVQQKVSRKHTLK